jgi:hypothetical protein
MIPAPFKHGRRGERPGSKLDRGEARSAEADAGATAADAAKYGVILERSGPKCVLGFGPCMLRLRWPAAKMTPNTHLN